MIEKTPNHQTETYFHLLETVEKVSFVQESEQVEQKYVGERFMILLYYPIRV